MGWVILRVTENNQCSKSWSITNLSKVDPMMMSIDGSFSMGLHREHSSMDARTWSIKIVVSKEPKPWQMTRCKYETGTKEVKHN